MLYIYVNVYIHIIYIHIPHIYIYYMDIHRISISTTPLLQLYLASPRPTPRASLTSTCPRRTWSGSLAAHRVCLAGEVLKNGGLTSESGGLSNEPHGLYTYIYIVMYIYIYTTRFYLHKSKYVP